MHTPDGPESGNPKLIDSGVCWFVDQVDLEHIVALDHIVAGIEDTQTTILSRCCTNEKYNTQSVCSQRQPNLMTL